MDNERPDFEERKKHMKQFSEAKQIKKKEENPIWKWVREMFFSGRTAKDILKDVTENQIVPQLKDNISSSLKSVVDMAMFKEQRSSTPSGSFVTNYVSFSKTQSNKNTLEENKRKEEEIIRSGYETPAFKFKKDANDFLASIKEYVQRYHSMSVLDLAWMQGKTISYSWEKYVWDEEEIMAIKEPTHISNSDTPWAVILPKAHELT